MTSQEITQRIPAVDLKSTRTARAGDPRLWERAENLKLDKINVSQKWVLLGHPDHEGVELNRGRKGAGQAPTFFRKYFYSLVDLKQNMFDAGDTDPQQQLPLSHRHELAEQASKLILDKNYLLAIGGGHDYAYPNIKAFLDKYPKKSLVLNIDAHLDLRPCDPHPHSGTGFRRLFEEDYQYKLIEFGYHPSFASKEQIEFAKKHKVTLVSFEDRKKQRAAVIHEIHQAEHVFLSIDIDGFSSSIAPGASAAWPVGLEYNDIEDIFLACHPKMRAMGIYELAPQLDVNEQTAKLAAQLAYLGVSNNYGN